MGRGMAHLFAQIRPANGSDLMPLPPHSRFLLSHTLTHILDAAVRSEAEAFLEQSKAQNLVFHQSF